MLLRISSKIWAILKIILGGDRFQSLRMSKKRRLVAVLELFRHQIKELLCFKLDTQVLQVL